MCVSAFLFPRPCMRALSSVTLRPRVLVAVPLRQGPGAPPATKGKSGEDLPLPRPAGAPCWWRSGAVLPRPLAAAKQSPTRCAPGAAAPHPCRVLVERQNSTDLHQLVSIARCARCVASLLSFVWPSRSVCFFSCATHHQAPLWRTYSGPRAPDLLGASRGPSLTRPKLNIMRPLFQPRISVTR